MNTLSQTKAPHKAIFQPKSTDFFLISQQKQNLRGSLEAPRRGASSEHHKLCFCEEIRKILFGYPLLSGIALYDKLTDKK